MKKFFLISAIVLISVGAALFLIALASAGFDLSSLNTLKYEGKTYYVNDSFDKIDISGAEADIILKTAKDGQTRVECEESEKTSYIVNVEDGTLKITMDDERDIFERFNIFPVHKEMTVYLSAAEYSALKINNSSYDVVVNEGFTFGKVNIDLSTGDVSFFSNVNGDMNIDVGTGDVKIDGGSAENLDVKVSTGKVGVNSFNVSKTITIDSGTGKVLLSDVACKDLYSNGGTGDVDLKNVLATGFIGVELGTGDVKFDNSDAAEIKVNTSTGDVTGTLRTAKVFIAKVSTGKATVPDTYTGGKCEITTSTGKINISLANN